MPSSINHTVQVTIVNDNRGEKCDVGCGIDWSSAEAITLASQRLKEKFGNRVKLVYLDLSIATTSRDTLEWRKIIKDKNLSLPLLLVNEQPRISGPFDVRQLLDVVDAVLETGVY
ncbi:hypothetical protein ACFLUJ_04060 [Chloroflexota bacterium]